MKIAFFDLLGTIIHHKTCRALPLMNEILQALKRKGWSVVIVTSYSEESADKKLQKAGIRSTTAILSSSESDGKGGVIAQYLARHPSDESFFVDDQPKNLKSVKSECGERVRVIGFVGSRKYIPEVSTWCAKEKMELALSASDLCAYLRLCVDPVTIIANSRGDMSFEEIATLIPGGIYHPLSNPTYKVFLELIDRWPTQKFNYFWQNIGWIGCDACIWKALVESVLKSLSLCSKNTLGGVYKDYTYTSALKNFALNNPQIALVSAFNGALLEMKRGIVEIGIEAECCPRPRRFPLDPERIQKVEKRLFEVF
jgi:hypothetical protein